ncbi:unnamed protein product [Mucor fragilis]
MFNGANGNTLNKDILLSFIDFQLVEYEKLMTLSKTLNEPQLGEAVNDAKSRALTIKRKYEGLFTAESSNKRSTSVSQPPITSTTTTTVDRNGSKHEEAVELVAEYKRKTTEQGKRISWVACLQEGNDLNLWNYKNSEALRQQFLKYIKKGKLKETNPDNT